MANIWMTRDDMIADSAILPASFTAKYLDSNDTYIDCTYTKNDVLQNRVGVSDTTCDMSFWQNGDSGTNNRFIAQYFAQNITNLPSAASARRITIDIPVYMRNVKYLDICFCVWIDLGYARGASFSTYNDASAIAYVKGGDALRLYCIPTPGNDHPGTGRLSIQGSPGFVPFHFFYDDDDNPVNIDFITLEFAGAYSENNQLNVWISQPCYNDDIVFTEDPQPEEQGGEWGAPTDRAGGQGVHAASSDARGDRAGTTVRDIMADRNTALSIAFDNPFMRTYTFDGLTNSQIAEIFAILYGTDYWSMFQNQMLNPLSSIIAFHLLPSTLRGDNTTLEDLVIGPKNISADMLGTPQVTKIKQVRWYHVGSVDITDVLLPYYDAYPDFAPYTDIILHLPYIGDIKIDVNAVMYGSLAVEYACDNVSGNVAAWIYCEDRYPEPQTHKQYKYIATGNCAYSIPLFAQSQNGLDVGKIIGSGIGIVGGAATGNLAAAVSGAMGIGSALYEHSRAPISTQSTGGSSGNVSILGDTDVWIEVIRPQWIQPESYQQLVGIPSGIAGTLSDIRASGRVVCSDIETDGIAATEPELREIERLLLSGIYLKPNS